MGTQCATSASRSVATPGIRPWPLVDEAHREDVGIGAGATLITSCGTTQRDIDSRRAQTLFTADRGVVGDDDLFRSGDIQ